MGLAMKNGILLVDYANQRRADGLSARDAILEAGPVRLRPVLMTTVATIAGMVPVALAHSDGAEFRQPMGVLVIGGLVSSTLLTMVVVPVAYVLVDGLAGRAACARPRGRVERPARGEAGRGLSGRKAMFAAPAQRGRPPCRERRRSRS
jgi:HAE1 family hydrophobic/amphiphilic exporter-1